MVLGNYEGPHDHDIDLRKVRPIILRVRPATIPFEAANARHAHEWEIWRDADLPDDKIPAPGLIDTCSNYFEHPRLIAQNRARFIDFVGRERVVASTACGFGTFAGYGKLDPEICWRKLAVLREGTDMAVADRSPGRSGDRRHINLSSVIGKSRMRLPVAL